MGQLHQHYTSSFSTSSFVLYLLAHGVQCKAQKLGAEYHKFAMPTGISYALDMVGKLEVNWRSVSRPEKFITD